MNPDQPEGAPRVMLAANFQPGSAQSGFTDGG
jgi:hypothetical protein